MSVFFYSNFLSLVFLAYSQNETKYTKKSITYLRMVFPDSAKRFSDGVDFLTGFNLFSYLEKNIREAVEMQRFDYNPVNVSGNVDLKTLSKLVKQYVDEVKVDRAKAEAKMDWRFKDLVITAEDIKKIAESAYIYYPEIRSFSVSIAFLPRRDGEIDKFISVNIALVVHYWRVDFDTGEPIKVAEISVDHGESVKVGRIDLVPLPFPFSLISPSVEVPETSLQAFLRCSEQVIYWLARKVNRETRKIPDFSLFAPVESVSFGSAFAPLTKKDGVYLDSDFEVLEEFEYLKNGEKQKSKKRVGWVRARDIADGNEKLSSSFQILSGSAEIGQIVSEYPLLGIGLSPFGIYIPEKSAIGFSLLANISLPRAFSLNLSEFYLFGGPEIVVPKDWVELNALVGFRKKFYIRSVGINPEFAFTFTRLFTEVQQGAQTYSAYANSIGIKPALGLEWFFSPRFSLYLISGYRLSSLVDTVYYEIGDLLFSGQKEYNPSAFFISGGFDITIW
ncbi:MAG: hypothetical protein NZ927_00570 [Candidatus Calescibacterium sp.]|nr:hypothetical protein [Candidatus Calescibacterium sp.]MCX7733862.1 hypothetical protein [bacterium]MDW8086643.1 hypothetical protein [Candidatus Calescibacterium sp.]